MLRISGTKVVTALAARQWSQSKLASITGVDKNTINQIVRAGEVGSMRRPDTVGLIASALKVDVHELLVNDTPLSRPLAIPGVPIAGLARLLQRLRPLAVNAYKPPFDVTHTRHAILDRFVEEAITMFRQTNVLDVRNLQRSLQDDMQLATQSWPCQQFRALIDATTRSQLPCLGPPSTGRYIDRTPTVHLVPSLLGAVLMFEHVRVIQGLDLDISYINGLSALPLRLQMLDDASSDLVALPLISAARFLTDSRSSDYRLLMIMPRGTHRVLAPSRDNGDISLSESTFVLLGDAGATAKNYLLDLGRLGLVDIANVNELQCDVSQFRDTFSNTRDNVRAVLYFPLTVVCEVANDFKYLDNAQLEPASKESYLFASRRFCESDARVHAITHSLHTAFDSLRTNDALVRGLIEMLFCDNAYISSLSATLGLVCMNP